MDLDADGVQVYRLEGGCRHPVLLGRGDRLTSPGLEGFEVAVDDLPGEEGADPVD